jgi:hypothetical protein
LEILLSTSGAEARLDFLELYAALKRRSFTVVPAVLVVRSVCLVEKSRLGPKSKSRSTAAVAVSAPSGQKRVTHRAWGPVRNDKEFGGVRLVFCRMSGNREF